MTRSALRCALAALVAAVALGTATAYAAYPNTPAGAQKDCGAGHDPLVGHYSVSVLQRALATLPGSDAEYTNCVDALRNAIRAALDHKKGSTGGGGTHKSGGGTTGSSGPTISPPSSVIRKTLHIASIEGRRPRTIGGVTVTPGAVASSGFLNSIPTPLLVVLAALAAILLGVSAYMVRTFVRARRSS
jgi:hypothetical protein